MTGYITAFRRAAARVSGLTDDERLDRFIRGLQPKILDRVLQADPIDFESAARIAERAASIL